MHILVWNPYIFFNDCIYDVSAHLFLLTVA